MTSIKDLQTRLGVDADGIVGPGTLRAIYKALNWPEVSAKPPAASKTIADFIGGFIDAHDSGNWTSGTIGVGNLVGSKYGVTAAALAEYRGVTAASITAPAMAALTRDEAVNVGVKLFYQKPGFDKLVMNRVTLSIIDFGWGAHPRQATKEIQRLIGVADDGVSGPATAAAYAAWITRLGEEAAAKTWGAARNAYYDLIITRKPVKAKYRKGWRNRTAHFLPGGAWWAEWAGVK
jgi:lysozyme family protein